ncbi:MAG: hypothetical protein LBQ65_09935 [Tannerellaceae bacterium]|jgi:hypothetical protein|nr:hypothetical protein [Tannerellaceae bacterium]
MKTRFILLSLCFAACGTAEAQLDSMQKRFWEERQQFQNRFTTFVDSIDMAFAAYLAQSWELFKVEQPIEIPPKPEEPQEKPVYIPEDSPATETPLILEPVDTLIEPVVEKENIQRMDKDEAYKVVKFEFFGTPVMLDVFSGYETNLRSIGEKQVADYWLQLSKTPHRSFLDDLIKKKDVLSLNHWGFYLFIRHIADACFSEQQANEKTIFTVFFLNQSGYKAKIGRAQNALVVLLALQHTVYGNAFIRFNDGDYYIFGHPRQTVSGQSIASYKLNYERAKYSLSLQLLTPVKLAENIQTTRRTYNMKDYTFKYNKNLVDFYNTYPQTELSIYAITPSKVSLSSWEEQLSPDLQGKDTLGKLTFLLSFIQNSFQYKTDWAQFGHEKFFFAEETLHYPYSDCEDRAILFSRMVHFFCGLDVLLIEYPSHVAAVVKSDEAGDAILYNNERYVVCDPTFIGAPVGKTMKGCDNTTAKIIAVK